VAAFPLRGALCELFEILPNDAAELGREEKTASFGKSLVLTAGPNILADLVEASSRN
jgi:hypothetical protein